jgi:ArgJ family
VRIVLDAGETAWPGADPNWGRMLVAIGYSGVKIDLSRISIYLGGQQVCRNGAACPFDNVVAHQYMSQPEYEIRCTLGAGKASLDFFLRSDRGVCARECGLQYLAIWQSTSGDYRPRFSQCWPDRYQPSGS